jgi:acetyl-CoA synthetase
VKGDRSSLRVLGTVGEPINPEAWKWYYEVVGSSQCAIVDTYWQTETGTSPASVIICYLFSNIYLFNILGGHMIVPLPGVTKTKPGSATLPFFGIKPVILSTQTGAPIEEGVAQGVLGFAKPWPSIARTVYGDHQRYDK